jgi:hypothetical protein
MDALGCDHPGFYPFVPRVSGGVHCVEYRGRAPWVKFSISAILGWRVAMYMGMSKRMGKVQDTMGGKILVQYL